MCFKIKEDPDGDFSINVPPRTITSPGRSSPLPPHIGRRSSQRVIVQERSPHTSGQLRRISVSERSPHASGQLRRISVSERSPHASVQLVRPLSVSERSPRTSRNRLSASNVVVQTRSPHSSGRLLQANIIELPRADPISLPAAQAEPMFVQTREPPPPEAPEPPQIPRASRSSSVHGERQRSRSRAYSSTRQGDFLTPQQSPRSPSQASPRSSAVQMERQSSGHRSRGESQSRHERRPSKDHARSKYAEDAERLSREPSQNRKRDSQLYLEDGRRQEGARFVEERIIQGEGRTTKQYYYV